MNLAIGVFAIPFMALIAWLMQIYVAGYEFDYQFNLCIPVITTFGIALSIIFRRKCYTKTGFFIQFIGPALFLLLLNLEALIACS